MKAKGPSVFCKDSLVSCSQRQKKSQNQAKDLITRPAQLGRRWHSQIPAHLLCRGQGSDWAGMRCRDLGCRHLCPCIQNPESPNAPNPLSPLLPVECSAAPLLEDDAEASALQDSLLPTWDVPILDTRPVTRIRISNYNLQAKSSPQSAFVNKVLSTHSHAHPINVGSMTAFMLQ